MPYLLKKIVSCRSFKKIFHLACTELKTIFNFNKLKQDNELWNCVDCQVKNFTMRKKNELTNISSNSDSKSNFVNSTNSIKFTLDEIINTINLLTKFNTELENSVNYCSDKVDSFDMTINKLFKTIKEHDIISNAESRC